MKYKTEFFVGLFIIIGLTYLLILIFKTSNFKSIYKKEPTYKITAIFKNIGNLKKKSRVTIGGVKIGIVNNIKLKKTENDEYLPEVEMLIKSKFKEIPIDSSINILMSSLLGESYIQIETGNENIYFKDGDKTILTTQALIIEELVSKLAFNK